MVSPISLRPKTESAISFASAGASPGSKIPRDLLEDTARRLGFLCLFILAVSVFSGIANELFIHSALAGARANRYTLLGVAWAATLGTYALTRWSKLPPTRLLDIGLGYEVFVAALIGLMVNRLPWPDAVTLPGWSPVAVWILLFSFIVPNTPQKTLLATLAAAIADPLSVAFYTAIGVMQLPPTDVMVQRFLPNLIAVAAAVAGSAVVYRIQQKLSTAREMGSYKLRESLGQGGMGEVWRAEHRMLARPAAVKLIRTDRLGASDRQGAVRQLQRFEREVQATAALRSPHTIEVFDFGIAQDGTFYYVMELLDGLDLQSLVEDHGAIPPERVVFLLRQACHSLNEAHSGGLVHRDIKPANIFMCRYGSDLDFVKVLDFGLVREWEEPDEEEAKLTAVGHVVGTPQFMPPEMAMADADVDGRADIYALGCVGYWLVTGRLPFEGKSIVELLIMHSREQPVPPSQRGDRKIPAQLEQVILRCLAKNPGERPQSALELSEELHAIGIEKDWTAERAAKWWKKNLPAAENR